MTNWNNPQLSNSWSNFVTAIKERDEANAKMDYSGDSNRPEGTIRWNASNSRFEILESGSWNELTGLYQIKAADAGDADNLGGNDSAYHLDRSNHTGSQTLSTISDAGTAASRDANQNLRTSDSVEFDGLARGGNPVVTSAADVERRVFVSTNDPSGGNDGDIWLKYE